MEGRKEGGKEGRKEGRKGGRGGGRGGGGREGGRKEHVYLTIRHYNNYSYSTKNSHEIVAKAKQSRSATATGG